MVLFRFRYCLVFCTFQPMINVSYPWSEVFTGSTLLVGSVVAFLLLLNKFPAGRLLGQIILGMAVFLLAQLAGAHAIKEITLLGLGILLRWYASAFFHQKSRIKWVQAWPFLICCGYVVLTYCISGSSKEIVAPIVKVFVLVFLVLSLYAMWKEVYGEAKTRGFSWSHNPGSRLLWLRWFLIVQTVVLLCCSFPFRPGWIAGVPLLITLSFLLYQLSVESSFFSPIPVANKYKKSTLTPGIKSAVLSKLDRVMEQQRFYLQDDASLGRLAKELGVSTHHLSQVLNETKKISFQDLISQYRVREASRLLRDAKEADTKIENIASRVGYNSKSAFNTAFKKKMGMTPSEFRAAKDVLTYGEERLPERSNTNKAVESSDLSVLFKLKTNGFMYSNFFKVFLRNLRKNRLFSALNMLGLTVGFTCSILIYLYIQHEQSYDRAIPNAERIYRVVWQGDNPQTRTPHPMAQAMVQDFPEVSNAVSFSPWYGPGLTLSPIRVKHVAENRVYEERQVFFADSTFLDVFDLKVIAGDSDALAKPSLVLSKEMAEKYFGDANPIDQQLAFNGIPMHVSAVVESLPEASHFHFNALISYVGMKEMYPENPWFDWQDFGHFNYLTLHKQADAHELEAKLLDWVAGYLDWDQERIRVLREGNEKFALQPIPSIHLHSDLRWELETNGSAQYIYILSLTLLFLLLISGLNYVNLTTTKSMERAKEVGVRKTLGCSSSHLSFQFYLETLLFCAAALVFSFVLAAALLKGFNHLSGKTFLVDDLLQRAFIARAAAVCLVLGLLAAFYPAFALSSFDPVKVLKGRVKTSSQGNPLRSSLVVLQFIVSAILISGSLTVFQQVRYMKDKELGFNKESVLALRVPLVNPGEGADASKMQTAQTKIEKISSVKATALASNLPGAQFNQFTFFDYDNPQHRTDASTSMVGVGYSHLLGLEIVKGRFFEKDKDYDSTRTVVINETMMRQLHLENPLGKKVVADRASGKEAFTVVGVVKDFHFQSLHTPIQPLVFHLAPGGASHILVKLTGEDFAQSIQSIERIYTELIDDELPFEYQFLDQTLAALYAQEERTFSIFSIFSSIALVLASLGLLGMALAVINHRIQEVGVRKILGASSTAIMLMILFQFLKLIAIALCLGLPLSYFLMESWVQEFSYRAPFGVFPYVSCVVVIIVAACGTVWSSVMKISFANPAQSLRQE